MTTLPNLPSAPATVNDAELIYVSSPTNGNVKRTLAQIVTYVLGSSPTALRGFFGATPVARPASTSQAAVPSTPISATAGASYTSTEQALINALKAQVNAQTVLINQMRADLVALGLIKGSA